MVGGSDFEQRPFNLATQGRRQPGSAFKPFTLVAALEKGISPGRTFVSAPKTLDGPRGAFKVENYEDRYAGVTSLAAATTVSDNSVYAEVGYKLVGTRAVAKVAKEMGVRTPVSRNPAMVLGGLKQGVTPLEMAQVLRDARRGRQRRVRLARLLRGRARHLHPGRGQRDRRQEQDARKRVIPEGIAEQATQILSTVVTGGTGRAASIGEFAAGKTGTTENYQDAWFVGFNDDLTVAVWVGYPEGAKPMETEYRGEPVAGGTFPAEIWHDFMLSVRKIREVRNPDKKEETPVPTVPTAPAPVEAERRRRHQAEARTHREGEAGAGARPGRDRSRPRAGARAGAPARTCAHAGGPASHAASRRRRYRGSRRRRHRGALAQLARGARPGPTRRASWARPSETPSRPSRSGR